MLYTDSFHATVSLTFRHAAGDPVSAAPVHKPLLPGQTSLHSTKKQLRD